jgi:hypothetical protein
LDRPLIGCAVAGQEVIDESILTGVLQY